MRYFLLSQRAIVLASTLAVALPGADAVARGPSSFDLLAPQAARATLRASATSDDVRTVVGWGRRSLAGPAEAFRWTLGGGLQWIDAGRPDVLSTAAHGVSSDGAFVVGAAMTDTGPAPFVWSAHAGFALLAPPDSTWESRTATGVTPDGRLIVGTSVGANGQSAFRWTAQAGLEALPLAQGDSEALAVSDDGRVIVGALEGVGGALWFDDDAPIALTGALATDVSADGTRILLRQASSTAAIVEVALGDAAAVVGVTEIFGGLPASFSANGQRVAGGRSSGDSALVWSEASGAQGVRLLLEETGLVEPLVGWTLQNAVGMNDDAVIVGNGIVGGRADVWIARAAFSACRADRNADRLINHTDLAFVLAAWGAQDASSIELGDVNDDGVVDAQDLALVLAEWGVCR